MDLPHYLMRPPPMPGDAATLAAFEQLAEAAMSAGGAELDYRLAAARWQFLCHLADTGRLLLHGSGNPGIASFEPRKAAYVHAFGDQQGVYAASDSLGGRGRREAPGEGPFASFASAAKAPSPCPSPLGERGRCGQAAA